MKYLWALIPASAQVWVIIGIGVFLIGVLGTVIWKIEDYGYQRSEAIHKAAETKQKETSQKTILDLGVSYDERETILKDNTDSVGANVSAAIDSLPDHGSR